VSSSDIIARLEGGVGRLTLNRPKALHALTTAMCEAMAGHLQDWREDPSVQLVMLDHAGDRGFCAGGDIRMLAESGRADGLQAREFFYKEYQLNALLMAYPKPTLAIMDGVVMGGGVGLSLPCRYRAATPRTTFAMPETGIGLFPDVGGGWHLSRLPGESGMWLALTGARLKAEDCRHLGIATHVLGPGGVETLKQALGERPLEIETLLGAMDVPAAPAPYQEHEALIDRTFSAQSVEEVLTALEREENPFAQAQRETLLSKSPQTLKVAFRELRIGRTLGSFEEDLAMEYRIGSRVVGRHDFLEGVRAVIVDKDGAPRWDPADLSGVSEALLDEIFAPLPEADEWKPLERRP
jgi:enoyl-CoA hydratase